ARRAGGRCVRALRGRQREAAEARRPVWRRRAAVRRRRAAVRRGCAARRSRRMSPAIEIASVVKRYGSFEALRGVTLSIREGEFFGLLGPNGAGKTTLISIVA